MRLNELDLLRFIAALAVVLFHYVARYTVDVPIGSNILRHIGMVTQFGFLGVHLFFMISGFVILVSAENRSNFEFCIVRFVRLFPTYWLSVTLTSLTIYLAIPSHNLELSTYLINLTMLQSYVGVSNIDGIYWTLAKELQFYACIFILISCKLISKIDYWLTGWLLLTVIYILIGQPFFMGWFISPEFSSLFIAGVYFYLIRKNSMKMHYLLGLTISLVLSMYQAYISSPSFLKTFTSMEQIISSIIILFFYLIFYLAITNQ